MEGLGYGILVYYIIVLLGVIGLALLVTAFIVRLKNTFGKILLGVGLLLMLPFVSFTISRWHHQWEQHDEMGSLFQAIEEKQYDAIERLLKQGEDANEVNLAAYPATPLTYAISNGDIRIVRMLVENGARVNLDTTNATLPLNQAIFQKDTAIVVYLLEHGANVSQESCIPPETPIDYAMRMSAGADIIQILLRYGAKPDSTFQEQE